MPCVHDLLFLYRHGRRATIRPSLQWDLSCSVISPTAAIPFSAARGCPGGETHSAPPAATAWCHRLGRCTPGITSCPPTASEDQDRPLSAMRMGTRRCPHYMTTRKFEPLHSSRFRPVCFPRRPFPETVASPVACKRSRVCPLSLRH